MDVTGSEGGQAEAAPPGTASPDTTPRTRMSRLPGARLSRPGPQGLVAFALYLVVFILAAGMPLARHLNVPDFRQYWTDVQF